jgi:hypothetical protein
VTTTTQHTGALHVPRSVRLHVVPSNVISKVVGPLYFLTYRLEEFIPKTRWAFTLEARIGQRFIRIESSTT